MWHTNVTRCDASEKQWIVAQQLIAEFIWMAVNDAVGLRLGGMVRLITKDGNVHERPAANGVAGTTYEMVDKSRPTMLVLTKDGNELDSTHRWVLAEVDQIQVLGGPVGPSDLLGVRISYVK